MGITRRPFSKKESTGGRQKQWHKKRKTAIGRPTVFTKIGPKRVHVVRTRGANRKFRALSLESGNFSWGSESTTHKTRIVSVVYSATNNEFVRTNTLVKNSIVSIDAAPFRQWYEHHYGVKVSKKGVHKEEKKEKVSKHVAAKLHWRQEHRTLDKALEEQFTIGRLLAAVSSRPGQSGRCDGYILEGPELEFYQRKLSKKKEGKK